MKTYPLEIVTPAGKKFDGPAVQLSVPAIDGSLSVLADHIPLATALKAGEVRIYLENGDTRHADCGGGMLVVTKEKVQLLSSTFDFKD